MKILYIIESLRAGGKERRLVQLIKGIKSTHNAEIDLIILNEQIHYDEIYDLDVKIFFLKRNIFKDFSLLNKFVKILNKNNPDIVHCWDNIAAIHFAPICKFFGYFFINSMITTAPKNISKFSKRYLFTIISYPFSDIILSNSFEGLKSFNAPKSKSCVIHNGFDFKRISNLKSKDEVKKKYEIDNNKFIIGMVGGFNWRKDFLTFAKSAKFLKEKCLFLTVGDGPNLIDIKRFVLEEGLDNFLFLGKQKNIEEIINVFDIGVLMSNNSLHGEGISNVIMEYMALGKPVIASRGGGTGEIVLDHDNGFLIEPKNTNQLSEKIIKIKDNLNLRKRISENAKKTIFKKFSLDLMVNKTFNLYLSSIIKNKK